MSYTEFFSNALRNAELAPVGIFRKVSFPYFCHIEVEKAKAHKAAQIRDISKYRCNVILLFPSSLVDRRYIVIVMLKELYFI